MSEKNILLEIVEKRKADMAATGINFGFNIPEKRSRKVHPFLNEKGVILEVKRASPSKGDIAPDLNSYDTAKDYAKAGAKAISCLTETNYFKGTLEDLMKVCKAVDDYEAETGKTGPAVLRKDFLISPEEVEVAYNAGADAVLLISRILDVPTMTAMAKKCEELGITALVELRLEEDIEKLAQVIKQVDKKYIVSGVNSRDLSNFTIDLLTPCAMLTKIKKVLGQDERVVFESGIRTVQSAAFVGSLGFAGMLLGEAAAKNPEIRSGLVSAFTNGTNTKNADFWNKYAAEKDNVPKVKICGLTNTEDAKLAAECGADFLGFIFWNKSPRAAEEKVVLEVRKTLGENRPVLAGVIVDPQLPESKTAIKLVKDGVLDVLQLHTMKGALAFLQDEENRKLPHYCAINISSKEDVFQLDQLFDLGEPRVLVDAQSEGKIGGTGKQISEELVALVQKKYKLWIAGGISEENILQVNAVYKPELMDIASKIEAEPGIKNKDKLKALFKAIK